MATKKKPEIAKGVVISEREVRGVLDNDQHDLLVERADDTDGARLYVRARYNNEAVIAVPFASIDDFIEVLCAFRDEMEP